MPLPPRTPFRSGMPVFPEPFQRAMLARWEGLVGDLAQAGHAFHEAAQALRPEPRGGEVPQPWEP